MLSRCRFPRGRVPLALVSPGCILVQEIGLRRAAATNGTSRVRKARGCAAAWRKISWVFHLFFAITQTTKWPPDICTGLDRPGAAIRIDPHFFKKNRPSDPLIRTLPLPNPPSGSGSRLILTSQDRNGGGEGLGRGRFSFRKNIPGKIFQRERDRVENQDRNGSNERSVTGPDLPLRFVADGRLFRPWF